MMASKSDNFWDTLDLIDFDSSGGNRDEIEKMLTKYRDACKIQLDIIQRLMDDPNLDLRGIKKRAFRQRIDGSFEAPLRYGRQKVLIRGQSGVQAKDLSDLKRIYSGLIERAGRRDELLISALIDAYGRMGKRGGASAQSS
jgi:hypothetical protein